MGWISDRHMKTGTSLNSNPKNNGSGKGPLRKVVEVLGGGNGMFEKLHVKLECGHEVSCTGGVRARCPQCKRDAEATTAAR